ncbi:helix-turn-helix transcriptional regulator [Roseovarius sp.]|uniref:helix-turn-helix transcriptional regulator n=1 Tax=Roseovarius sp. TaxID=1486281 RepID=UPI003517E233
MTDKILRCREVQEIIGLSRSTIYRMMARGEFPRSQKLGARAVGWRESAINQWVEQGADQNLGHL